MACRFFRRSMITAVTPKKPVCQTWSVSMSSMPIADIVALLRERGMLVAEENYQHSYPYCWRSKTPIIFRAVEQFFIRIDDLRAHALAAIKQVNWIPPWGEKRIAGTVEVATRLGHLAPTQLGRAAAGFLFRRRNEAILNPDWIRKLADSLGNAVRMSGSSSMTPRSRASSACPKEHAIATKPSMSGSIAAYVTKPFCATHPELHDPADMYLEATDQHRGWFQSSLMTSVALHDRAPYQTCVTHGFVVDVDGKKISKSSSYSKPMDAGHFVGKHGADIVRLWVSSVNYTDDVPFSEEMFTRLGDTYRRIRNTLAHLAR